MANQTKKVTVSSHAIALPETVANRARCCRSCCFCFALSPLVSLLDRTADILFPEAVLLPAANGDVNPSDDVTLLTDVAELLLTAVPPELLLFPLLAADRRLGRWWDDDSYREDVSDSKSESI